MQIEAERSLLIKDLKQVKDLSTLLAVKDFLLRREAAAKGIDLDEYNRDLDAAMKRMDAGQFTTHEDALKRLAKWRRKEK